MIESISKSKFMDKNDFILNIENDINEDCFNVFFYQKYTSI